eukprot:6879262-Lingulodinium_polyedra.AAC.1
MGRAAPHAWPSVLARSATPAGRPRPSWFWLGSTRAAATRAARGFSRGAGRSAYAGAAPSRPTGVGQ